MRVFCFVVGLISLVGLLSGCDSTPGPAALDQRPPVLSDFSYSPDSVDAGDVSEDQIVDGRVQVLLQMSVSAEDVDGDLEEVAFVVQSPLAGREPLAAGTLQAGGQGRYAGSTTVAFPAGEVGVYTVLVYAEDRSGRMSNQVRGDLIFTAGGGPPVIEEVEAIPEVVRPPTELKLIVTVSDPDGLGNISRVEGTTPTGSTFELFDDGQSRGDDTADDGRYTATFDVPSATPGTQTFRFQAFDRTGLASEVVEKQITIE